MAEDPGLASDPGDLRQETAARLRVLPDAWNRVESLLKLAELIRGEALIPAINELRYAGRSIVSVVGSLGEGTSIESSSEAIREIEHADFHLRLARMDAIDSIILFVSEACDSMISDAGMGQFLKMSPEAETLLHLLRNAKRAIVESRAATVGGKEAELKRDGIYQDLEVSLVPQILELYIQVRKEFQGISYRQRAKKSRERYLLLFTSFAIAVIIGVASNIIWVYLRSVFLSWLL